MSRKSALFRSIATELADAERLHEAVTAATLPPGRERAAELAAPRGAVAELLAEIWGDVLGLPRVGAQDHFFQLGGHSLLATRMLSRVAESFGVELPLRAVMEAPTLARLAARIEAARRQRGGLLVPPVERASRQGELPLSFAQQRYWFIDLLDPGSAAYNIALAYTVAGGLEEAALAASLGEIVRRHEGLRSRFRSTAGRPFQLIAPPEPVNLPAVDLRSIPAERRRAEAGRLAGEEAERPFDLAAGPLLRGRLLRLAERERLLLLTTHHIACDGSMDLLLRELAVLYGALSARHAPPLPEPRLHATDFAAWQRHWLSGEVVASLLTYWRQQLGGELPLLELPLDRPRPAVQSGRGARRLAAFGRGSGARLRAFSRQTSSTPFMTGLALFVALLHRYTEQRRIVVGTPVADRPPGLEEAIGCFVNTLVLSADVTSSSPFAALVRSVRETVLEAHAHLELPFELLVEALQPERDLSRTPLFQVMFNWHNAPERGAPRLPGIELSPFDLNRGTSRFDLLLTLGDAGEELRAAAEYDRGLFDAATVERLLAHLDHLLDAAAADRDCPLAALPLLGDAERHQLLVEWNDTAAAAGPDLAIHHLFAAQVERHPDATALIAVEGELTYRQLDSRANRLARHLLRLGLAPGELVAVYLDRSLDAVVALLGVLKAGGAYVPLEDSYPDARLRWILSALSIRCLLTQGAKLPRLDELGAVAGGPRHLVCLDAWCIEAGAGWRTWDRSHLDALPDADPGAAAAGTAAAYVIFTSGSTGTPKGVMVRHQAVVNLIQWVNDTFQVGPLDRGLFITSLCFDLSVYDVFGLLAAGASVRIAAVAETEDPERLLRLLRGGGITFWDSAPAAMQRLAPLFPIAPAAEMPALRLVFLSGDWIPLPLVGQIRGAFPAAEVVSLGGATEATVWSNVFRIAALDPCWVSVPYGRPIRRSRYHVLDESLSPCPLGVAGDLCIGGACLAAGYVNDPVQTARKYMPDPFAGEPGSRLYRTGDRARYRTGGDLEFLGRRDQQVKIRGFRIELGEIEAALRLHPAVREAVAVAAGEPRGERRLVAYLIPAAQPPTAAELRAFLRDRLPEYMVPTAFVALAEWPLTANGKLDRAALPSSRERTPERGAPLAPRNPVERLLADLWCEVLGLREVGVEDNFFELGGDSILAIQIIARANEAGLRVLPRQLFQAQTIALLAVAASGPRDDAPAAWAAAAGGEAPLAPIQRWFFAQELADPHHFNQAILLEVRQAPALLRAAFALVAARHDAFGLRFRREAEGWRQLAGAAREARFTLCDLSALPLAARGRAFALAVAAAQAALDLEAGPLARALYLDGGPELPARLLIVVHHLLVDGVSWRILLADLAAVSTRLAAAAGALPAEVRLPPVSCTYAAWCRQLAAFGRSPAIARQLSFWLAAGRAPAARLPVDGSWGENTVASSGAVEVALTPAETRALLQDLPRSRGARLDEALLAALAAALARWTGERRIRIDVEGHGRQEIGGDLDASRTVGWFTTIFPALLEAGEAAAPAANLGAVRAQLAAIPGHGLGYGLLRYPETGAGGEGDPELAALPPAEILFNYLGQLDQALAAGAPFQPAAADPGPTRSPRQLRRHLLEVDAAVHGGCLRLRWTYSENRHRRGTIAALAAGVAAELRALAAARPGPDRPLPADFPLAGLDRQRLDRLLELYPRIEDVYPLAPAQQGMLFHTLYAGRSGVYVGQLVFTIQQEVDLAALAGAWALLTRRHAVLRTAFVGDDFPQPLQVVLPAVTPRCAAVDWRALPLAVRRERFDAYLAADRERGFPLGSPPLARLVLFRQAADLYQLVWSYHHLVLDGWSLALLLRELLVSYQLLHAGREPAFETPRPFRAYLEWLGGQDHSAAESFWRRSLAGFTAPTPLPVERPEAAPPGPGGAAPRDLFAERRAILPRAAGESLQRFARRSRLTLSTLIHGAWALLLSRSSDSPDVVYGAVTAGRPATLPGVGAMVGVFINTLPARLAVPPQAPVAAWLAELQAHAAELRQHEHNTLVEIQGFSAVPRGVPLFESLVVYENYPVDQAIQELGGALRIGRITNREQTNYPLALLASFRDRLSLAFSYNRRRFDPATIGRLLAELETLLASMVAWPEAPLSELPLLSPPERHQLIHELNDTRDTRDTRSTAAAAASSLHGLVEAQAARAPEAVALVAGEERLSYGELNRRANRLARRLRAMGAAEGGLVGVCLERSPALVVALLAALKAGCAYLPLDPGLPELRLAALLAAAAPAVVVSRGEAAARLLAAAPPLLLLDPEGEERAPADDGGDLGLPTPAAALAYVIYTSGSTGEPKGVMTAHQAIVNRLAWIQRLLPLTPADRVLQKTPFTFDVSVWEIFWPLAAGARLVLARPRGHQDAAYLVRLAAREGVTTLHFVPAMLPAFLEQPELSSCRALRQVFASGEALTPALQQAFLARTTAALYNLYGPTEAAVEVTFWACRDPAPSSVPIGRPIANAIVRLLDRQLQPVPLGVPGELFIGGLAPARGYLGRPDLTAERFLPDPFSDAPGERLYRSGDLARLLPDGAVDFLGRVDHQIKIRGFRIEPGEIEAALLRHRDVGECVVVAQPAPGGGRRLVAYVTPAGGVGPDPGELRAFLADRLPEPMVPAEIIALARLPTTPSGKLDRASLPVPDLPRPAPGAVRVAPRTPVEEILAGLCAELLDCPGLGVDDNFFALGGHSLLAALLVGRVRRSLGAELPLAEVFRAPTVAAMAEVIESLAAAARGAGGAPAPPPPLVAVPRGEPLPASLAQQRLWVLDQLAPGQPTYNIALAVALAGAPRVAALASAFTALVRRHEALRTTFVGDQGQPFQVIAAPRPQPLPVADLAGLPAAARERELYEVRRREALRPFDLAGGPLLRTGLVRLGGGDHVLLVTLHHIIADGWSVGILVRELSLLYDCRCAGLAAELPELPVQYADFAQWQRRWLQGEVLAAETDHWRRLLAGAPTLFELPADRHRPALPSGRGGRCARSLTAALTAGLEALCRREAATLFMLLLAAFRVLLRAASGLDDVLVGTDVAGRTRAETEGVIGFFINQLVVRVDTAGDPTFLALLARVRQATLEGYAHQDLPFDRVVDAVQPQRSPGHAPLFQVKVNLNNAPLPDLRLAAIEATLLDRIDVPAQLDLIFNVAPSAQGLMTALDYNADLLDEASAARLLDQLETILARVVEEPEVRLSALEESLARGERRRRGAEREQRRNLRQERLQQAQRRAVEAP